MPQSRAFSCFDRASLLSLPRLPLRITPAPHTRTRSPPLTVMATAAAPADAGDDPAARAMAAAINAEFRKWVDAQADLASDVCVE